MAIGIGRNRAKEFNNTADVGVKDFDPEEAGLNNHSENDSSVDSDGNDEAAAREHYVDVGKSKLRKPKSVPLGPQYRGSQVKRKDLAEEDEDDPFSKGFDEDESSDDGGVRNEDDSESGNEAEGSKRDETDETDVSDDGDDDELVRATTKNDSSIRKELEDIKLQDQRSGRIAALSQASNGDADKGRAIKQQRAAFDSLLNTRMKLQKALVATNTLVGTPSEQLEMERADAQDAFQAAETAALQLWNSLNNFRQELEAAKTGEKRKRSSFPIDTSTDALWLHVQSQEAASRPARDAVLKKWSHKTQGPTVHTQAGRINQTAQATIIDAIEEQLSNTDRLVKRTHAPRSCAPLQASQRITEDDKIYDDADFYGLLLKELLEQKSTDSVAASNIDIGFQMRRENRTKRTVDTKASKGRKLRYTVHEKLQNFMAPEDRCSWGDRQADELFRSLFGQRLGLAEREEDEESGKEGGVDMEDAGLVMFGK